MFKLHHGDCLAVMDMMASASVDAIVTDPPYHLTSVVKRFGKPESAPAKFGSDGIFARASRGFMGKEWDGGDVAFRPETWAEALRVLKPGGHVLAFGGTRTYHRLAAAIEDAGFEIRDMISWLYGTGFPKSHNQPGGWGTALKPACEPIVLARKPLTGTVAANVLTHGTGALNVDGCRVGDEVRHAAFTSLAPCSGNKLGHADTAEARRGTQGAPKEYVGRWPANVVHDGSDEVLAAFPDAPGQQGVVTGLESSSPFANVYGDIPKRAGRAEPRRDSGLAARFFYSAKASRADRADGLDGRNPHPTVKPTALMQWLVRLVTPPGGVVLDPFAGSGSTGRAALLEGFRFVGIEKDPEYIDIARRRIWAAALALHVSYR